jgi:hypothetical protein
VNADHSIIESILDFLGTPQVQSALIAAVVSFIVACIVASLTTRRERRARRAQRAERLLREVYDPIEICLKAGSLHPLHRCVSQCRQILEKNRHEFPENILVLIDQALEAFVEDDPSDFGTGDEGKVHESEKQLDEIAKKLVPLLEIEMNRLKNLTKRETW